MKHGGRYESSPVMEPALTATKDEGKRAMTLLALSRLPPSALSGGLLTRLRLAMALRRQRRQVAALPDHLLRDIGLSPQEAQHEAARPLWDVPRPWCG